jgi:hypothetical protein
LSVLPRCEQRDLAALEERVVLGREALFDFEVERRDPIRIEPKHFVPGPDEVFHVFAGGMLPDFDAHDGPLSSISTRNTRRCAPRFLRRARHMVTMS